MNMVHLWMCELSTEIFYMLGDMKEYPFWNLI